MVTWMSATPTVATISNAAGSNGLVTTAGTGTSLITATLGAISGATDVDRHPPRRWYRSPLRRRIRASPRDRANSSPPSALSPTMALRI